jgi:hypothetical protein
MFTNLLCLFGGILGDPGVKDAIYINYTKERYGKQKHVIIGREKERRKRR